MPYTKSIIEFINIIKSPNLISGEFKYLSIKNNLEMVYPNIEVRWTPLEANNVDYGIRVSLIETIEILENFPEKNRNWFTLAALISSFLNESLNNISAEESFKKMGVPLPLDNSFFEYFAYTRSYLLETNFLYRLFTPKINTLSEVNIENIEFSKLGKNVINIGSGDNNKYIQNIRRFFDVSSLKEYLREIIMNDKHADNLWLSRIYFCHIFNDNFDELTIKSSLKAIGKSWGIVIPKYNNQILNVETLIKTTEDIIGLIAFDWFQLPSMKKIIKHPYKDFTKILIKDWCSVKEKEKLMFLSAEMRKKIEIDGFMLSDIITSSTHFKYHYLNELNDVEQDENENVLAINFKI